jgi:hypothetical protein
VVETSSGAGIGKKVTVTEKSGPPEAGKANEKTTTMVEAPDGSPAGKKTTTTEAAQRDTIGDFRLFKRDSAEISFG